MFVSRIESWQIKFALSSSSSLLRGCWVSCPEAASSKLELFIGFPALDRSIHYNLHFTSHPHRSDSHTLTHPHIWVYMSIYDYVWLYISIHEYIYSNTRSLYDFLLLLLLPFCGEDDAICFEQWRFRNKSFKKVEAYFLLNFDPNLKIPLLAGQIQMDTPS